MWKPPDAGEKWFCGRCGSAIYGSNPSHPESVGIRLGTFYDDPGLRPKVRMSSRTPPPGSRSPRMVCPDSPRAGTPPAHALSEAASRRSSTAAALCLDASSATPPPSDQVRRPRRGGIVSLAERAHLDAQDLLELDPGTVCSHNRQVESTPERKADAIAQAESVCLRGRTHPAIVIAS